MHPNHVYGVFWTPTDPLDHVALKCQPFGCFPLEFAAGTIPLSPPVLSNYKKNEEGGARQLGTTPYSPSYSTDTSSPSLMHPSTAALPNQLPVFSSSTLQARATST